MKHNFVPRAVSQRPWEQGFMKHGAVELNNQTEFNNTVSVVKLIAR